MNPVILCVDLDEWFHARWASGPKTARYPKLPDLFQNYYHSDRPSGEIIKPTEYILNTLRLRKIRATFFVLGEVAEWYPQLVRKIAQEGHEIASHGMHHRDLTVDSKGKFEKELSQSKKILEKLSGKSIIGYRAPNLVVTKWLGEVLVNQGIKYDSSVCPGREIQGKYKGQANIQSNPYRIGKTLLEKGNAKLIEIPIPTFPIIKWPGAVSIASRIFGITWTKITLNTALKTGATCYYLHPYEFNPPPKLKNLCLKEKVFLRRMGHPMEEIFENLLKYYRGRIISAKDYLEKFQDEENRKI